ncbi:hypothetical protein Tco_0466885, partial [Tanacetum coccineum]
ESLELKPENDDVDHDGENDSVSKRLTSENDDVTFGFSQVNANDGSKTVELTPENDDVDHDGENDSVSKRLTSENDDVTFGSSQAQTNTNEGADVDDEGADVDEDDADVDDEDDDDVEGEEFTFMCINSDNSI